MSRGVHFFSLSSNAVGGEGRGEEESDKNVRPSAIQHSFLEAGIIP
jgi:hypothetical protein